MNIDRNAAAFIDDGNGAIDMDRDLDRAAVTGQVLVDRVVQDLGNAMVQRPLVGFLRTASRPSSLPNFEAS
jgi:hypothetical protein